MLKNPDFKTNWQTGETCHYYEAMTDSVRESAVAYVDGDTVYLEDGTARTLESLFETHAAAMTAMMRLHDDQQAAFERDISDAADLVTFAYKHNVSGDRTTNWQARAAYAKRAKELLGIDLGA